MERDQASGEESIQEEEQNTGDQEELEVVDPLEELQEAVEYEENTEDNEDSENQDLAEAIGSWPVLSKYQSTPFKYQILTKDMFNKVSSIVYILLTFASEFRICEDYCNRS